MDENFSYRLRSMIRTRELSCYKLAKLSKVSKGTISNYVNGRITKPDIVVICKVCIVLNVSPSWILHGSGLPTLCESDIKYMRYKVKNHMSRAELEKIRNSVNRVIDELILMHEKYKALEEFLGELQKQQSI
ncbi:MAG: helix-turn-helix transcriptional regulator [Bacteroidales bacterium]|nr:helix-turn-helix transcriptional regulator [Bacteroidales bacterium]MBR2475556.1 helix-turn-helix transcriptional regulator [Bacteroidaceae bacterium]